MDSVALSNGLHGSVQMDSLALFSWIGWLRHRGILIYGPKQTYVLSIMSTNLVSNSNAQAVIRNISSIVYNYLNV